jgi:hypothetical protein
VATDTTAPPGGEIFLATLNAPPNSTFQDSGNGIGGFVFKPTFDEIGPHSMTFIATDDGDPALATVETVILAVLNQNRAPILDPISPQAVDEGDILILVVTASDPDGTTPNLTADSLPANAVFVDSGNGLGVLTFTPNYLQAGLYEILFGASDGLDSDEETALIQVRESGNQNPQWDPIPSQVNVMEWDTLTLVVHATDPEGQALTLNVSPFIEHATFVDSGNGVGVYEITPDYWQDGTYDLEFIVEDSDGARDTANVSLVVEDAGNQAPFFLPTPDTQWVVELQTLDFLVTVSDTDRTVPSLDCRPLPANANFYDLDGGLGNLVMVPDYSQRGFYDVYFVAFDEEDITLADSILVTIAVLDQNRAPEFDSASTNFLGVNLAQGDSISIWYAASDRDGTVPVMSAENLPSPSMTWADSGGGFLWLTFVPAYDELGQFTVDIVATDEDYDTSSVSIVQAFSVGFTNVPPELDSIGPQSVMEGQTLEFTVSATDPNGSFLLALQAFDLPTNSSFDTQTGEFSFSPTLMQAGVYYPLFQARDGSGAIDTERVEITVVELGNQAPQWESPFPSDTVVVTVVVPEQMSVWATDVDNSGLTLTVPLLPTNATFTDNGDMTGLFTFAPDSSQLGSAYTVEFIAADTSLADTATVIYDVRGFIWGDWTGDGVVDVLDVVQQGNYTFRNGPEPVPFALADYDFDGDIDVIDMVRIVDHVFRAGPDLP